MGKQEWAEEQEHRKEKKILFYQRVNLNFKEQQWNSQLQKASFDKPGLGTRFLREHQIYKSQVSLRSEGIHLENKIIRQKQTQYLRELDGNF
jgi:hypothetical protein